MKCQRVLPVLVAVFLCVFVSYMLAVVEASTLLEKYQNHIGSAGTMCTKNTANAGQIETLFEKIIGWHDGGFDASDISEFYQNFNTNYFSSKKKDQVLKGYHDYICSKHRELLNTYSEMDDIYKSGDKETSSQNDF